jgi:hypothetical protein
VGATAVLRIFWSTAPVSVVSAAILGILVIAAETIPG